MQSWSIFSAVLLISSHNSQLCIFYSWKASFPRVNRNTLKFCSSGYTRQRVSRLARQLKLLEVFYNFSYAVLSESSQRANRTDCIDFGEFAGFCCFVTDSCFYKKLNSMWRLSREYLAAGRKYNLLSNKTLFSCR